MNPEYMPPQYGIPPQGFPQGRPSPSMTPQGSMPPGPPKPYPGPPAQNGPNYQQNNFINSSPAMNIPPSQLPPGKFPQQGPPQSSFSNVPLSQANPPPNLRPPSIGPPISNAGPLNPPQQNLGPPVSNAGPQNQSNLGPPRSNEQTMPPPVSGGYGGGMPPLPRTTMSQDGPVPNFNSSGMQPNFGQPQGPPLQGPPQGLPSQAVPQQGPSLQGMHPPGPQPQGIQHSQPQGLLPPGPQSQGMHPPASQPQGMHTPASQPQGMHPQGMQPPKPHQGLGQPPFTGAPPGPPVSSGPPNSFGPPPTQNSFGPPPVQNSLSPQGPNKYPAPNQMGQALPPVQPPYGPPGQQPYGQPPGPPNPNQLASQMGGMQIGGQQRQYPGGPLPPKPLDQGLPHMPPPLNQQPQYVNGTQNRGPQSPGYPPMPPAPGQYPGAPGQYPGAPAGPYPQQPAYQQQQRRLDPDQMPSPIQVIQEDQRTRSGIFCTNQKGLVPPLVSTDFIVQDQGNSSPRFIRSTMYNVPTTSDMMKQTVVPFGLVISPLARTVDKEYPPPIVNFGELGPVRCIRCKAYMCPFMQFIDGGKRFQCLFCKATTEVPAEYFQHLDHTGQRVDRFERPELVLGTYEFVATTDYCRNNKFPKPPAVIFVIDVSYNNVKSGLVSLLCSEMKEIIKHLPVDQGYEKSNMKVGFITYNNTVHFYNIKGSLAQPQMLVVGDTQEMFMPLLDGFLCDIEESAAVIDSLMTQIPAMFGDTRETETVLLPAIQAGLEALKASECAGKLLVFHSTLPIADAPGRLKDRNDRKVLGTDKERTALMPQTQAYNQLGQDCVAVGCSVDLFIFNNSYIDLATIGQVARLTGGEVFKYTYFQADVDGDRLVRDVITDISRPIAFDSIMRVRTSTGVRATDFYGHFYMSNTTDMEIASIDCNKAIAVEIKHDDKLTEEEGVYIQVALLYTSCSGQRRLRVMNLSLKTCSQMADLYKSCDLDTLVNFFGKQAIYRLLESTPKSVKDGLVNRSAQILACYRKNCASPSSAGQLILPECMKLLPLYVNCLLKSDALSGGADITLDDRSFVMQAVTIMDVPSSVTYFYPRMIPIHQVEPGSDEIPTPIRCTSEKMEDDGVYILENGIHMFLWFGLSVNPDWILKVFGVQSPLQVDVDHIGLPPLDNELSKTVNNIVEKVRAQHHRCMRLTLVRQREKLEPVFRHFLVEDRGQDGSTSYVDFLCHVHKEIRTILS